MTDRKAFIRNILSGVAKTYLRIETLDVRNRDCYDFYDCHVANIEKALVDAYNKGYEASCEDIAVAIKKAG